MTNATIITIIGTTGVLVALGLLTREVVRTIREFEMRLERIEGKWWVTMR